MVELNRRRTLRLLALLPAFIHASRAWAAAVAVGSVTALKGKASAELGGKARALKLKAPLHLTETLITSGGEARLTALLAEKTTLKLCARTKVRIDSFIVDSGGELTFNSGALLLDAPSQSFEKGLTIDSRFALIAVRGTKFFAGRLGQVGLIALAGVVGMLIVRSYGLGLAAGGISVPLWLWIASLAEIGPNPVGIAYRNPGADDTTPHAVTTTGMVATIVLLVVAAALATYRLNRSRRG
jgi:hypothetical protein